MHSPLAREGNAVIQEIPCFAGKRWSKNRPILNTDPFNFTSTSYYNTKVESFGNSSVVSLRNFKVEFPDIEKMSSGGKSRIVSIFIP